MENLPPRVRELLARGVRIPHPGSVWIDQDVVPARIATDVMIHPGCRISGVHTAVGPGSVLGAEAPLTLEDSQLGENVELKGGYVSGAVFLDGANVSSGAHIRPGSLLEEEASAAHTVGFKQTILLPFVTTGSLVNFCDCLMAGGTSRKNHSEVGSSYIHFNFTPHQDKATASLIGEVPHGVMLNQAPIFLGGQGGLVGPARIAYGCVIPAGVVWRRDAPGENHLLRPAAETAHGPRPYHMGTYRDAARIFRNNLIYLGNIRALRAWYTHVRAPFMAGLYHRFCWEGALRQLDVVEVERRKRLAELVTKLGISADHLQREGGPASQHEATVQKRLAQAWPQVNEALDRDHSEAGRSEREAFLKIILPQKDQAYLKVIAGLTVPARAQGTAWLQAIVDATVAAGQAAEGD